MRMLQIFILAGLMTAGSVFSAERKKPVDPNTPDSTAQNDPNTADPNTATATFAAGCFWGVEYFFDQVPGVVSTEVGYTGGRTKNPTYKEVCRGNTRHAEAVELVYEPNKVSYETLVRLFFKMHDPTTRNRQGPDVGAQYRSAIFWHTPEQKKTADAVIKELTEKRAFTRRIVTEVTRAEPFWPAEDYHQEYFKKNKGLSCHISFSPEMLNEIRPPKKTEE